MQEVCVELANSLNLIAVKKQERVTYELWDIDILDSLVSGRTKPYFRGMSLFFALVRAAATEGINYSQATGRANGRNDR
jgi:hypothetical protein